MDAAAVRQGAVLALLPAEAAVQLRAEAAGVESPRRAEAAVQLRAEAAVQLRAEAAGLESPRRVEAAAVKSPWRAEAAVAELPRRAEAAGLESPRRVEAAYAQRWLEACSQEALKRCRTADCRRCYPWRHRCRWLFRHAAARREARDCPAESQCCRCRSSYRRRRYPRCPVTVIAGKRRGVGSGGDFCARGARRLHAGKRVIARQSRSSAPSDPRPVQHGGRALGHSADTRILEFAARRRKSLI